MDRSENYGIDLLKYLDNFLIENNLWLMGKHCVECGRCRSQLNSRLQVELSQDTDE